MPLSGRNMRALSSADHVQLNHYYVRSRAELAEKIAPEHNRAVGGAQESRACYDPRTKRLQVARPDIVGLPDVRV